MQLGNWARIAKRSDVQFGLHKIEMKRKDLGFLPPSHHVGLFVINFVFYFDVSLDRISVERAADGKTIITTALAATTMATTVELKFIS